MIYLGISTPCFISGSGCQLDWTAISAIGGWIGAAAAVFASVVALHLAAGERRKREAQQRAADKFALINIWPRLHRAQGCLTSIAYVIGDAEADRPTAGARDQLATAIEALETELVAIRTSGALLEGAQGERLVAVVALAGYVARQARRIARPESPSELDTVWYGGVRSSWTDDARSAAGQLLSFATDAERLVNTITGRKSPRYDCSTDEVPIAGEATE